MPRNPALPVVIAAAVIAAGLSVEAATLTPFSQTRDLEAEAHASAPGGDVADDSASDSAPDFSLFDSGIFATANAVASTPTRSSVLSDASATQISDLGPTVISAAGDATVDILVQRFGTATATAAGDGGASSLFDVVFTLDAPAAYSMVGSVSTDVAGNGDGAWSLANSVALYDVGGGSLLFETASSDEAFDFSGFLDAGTYRILASAAAEGDLSRDVAGLSSLIADSGYTLRFSINQDAVIPEPGTLLGGLGVGLLCGLSLWRRRARAR